jgi:DNA polymerase-4
MVAVVGGDEKSRHGIVLAKSMLTKPYNIQTGESLMEAKLKYRDLVVVPPKYDVFVKSSKAMNEIFSQYTPIIQKYSIDESWLDFTGMENQYPAPIELANEIKDRIKNELGFTVSVGISSSKLLSKMASEFKKPDGVSTLYPSEIKTKLFPLDIRELFGVGKKTEKKLRDMNINFISELANYDITIIKQRLKSYGVMLWHYANGIEHSPVKKSNSLNMKGIGNSTTASFDVVKRSEAHLILLSIVESVAMRLRDSENNCRLVEVSYVDKNFIGYSRQRKFPFSTDSTKKIAEIAYMLFDEIWKGEPIRKFGVRVSELCTNEFTQSTLYDDKDIDTQNKVDNVIDNLRLRFGSKAVTRASFIHSGVRGLSIGMGGGEEGYPLMSSQL